MRAITVRCIDGSTVAVGRTRHTQRHHGPRRVRCPVVGIASCYYEQCYKQGIEQGKPAAGYQRFLLVVWEMWFVSGHSINAYSIPKPERNANLLVVVVFAPDVFIVLMFLDPAPTNSQ